MELRDPVAVYDAADNMEAAVICQILTSSGIAAHVVEDASVVGQWAFGLLPQIHRPQIWIERADLARAKPILESYELGRAEKTDAAHDGAPIQVVCEECHRQSEFPAARRGSVETCIHCGAYVDVGDVQMEGWDESSADERET
jgi:hypothetical protein